MAIDKNKRAEMKKLILKPDKKFTPCDTDAGDEIYPNGIFEFNITSMIEFINGNIGEFPVEKINVKDTRSGFGCIDEDHINSVDVTKPIILAEISPGRYNVVDGNHRLEKAYRDNLETILAYRIKSPDHLQFLITQKAYTSYIDYWNEKVRNLFF